MSQIFEEILALISKKQFDRAESVIDAARNSLDASQMHRLTALSAVLEDGRGNTSAAIDLIRQAIREDPTWLPHWHRLADPCADRVLREAIVNAIANIDQIRISELTELLGRVQTSAGNQKAA